MSKSTKWSVRPVKLQISLGIRPVWSESSLCAQWVAKYQSFFHADSEDSDRTRGMPRLIWIFAGRTCHFVGFVMRRLMSIRFYTLVTEPAFENLNDINRWNKQTLNCCIKLLTFEPPHDKTNEMACAPSEDSDQPGHPPSLIRVSAVRMKKAWVLSYPLSAQRGLWSDWEDAQADLSNHSCHFVGFIMRRLLLG